MATPTRYVPSESTLAETARVAVTRKHDPDFVRGYLNALVNQHNIQPRHARRIWRAVFGRLPFAPRQVMQ